MLEFLEKGGKRAQIGEIRTWGGVKYIKHQEGWVFLKKDGTHHIEGPDGKRRPAEQHHQDHYNTHNTEKELQEDGGFKKEVKPEASVTRKIGKQISLHHNTKEDAVRVKSLTKHLMVITRDISKEIVENAAERFKEKGYEFTAEDKVYYRIGTTYDVMSAVSKYCKDTDKIVGWGIESDKDRVLVNLTIERDGQEFEISNQLIEAGGHNIQQYHTRMLTETELEENKDGKLPLSEELSPEQKKKVEDSYEILEHSYKDSKELLRLKRQPLRSEALTEKGEKFIDHLTTKITGETDNEYLHNLINDYGKNRVLYSNFDDKIKSGFKKIESLDVSKLGSDLREIARETRKALRQRVKEHPMAGDEVKDGNMVNSLKHFKGTPIGDFMEKMMIKELTSNDSYLPKGLKNIFERQSKSNLKKMYDDSKSKGDTEKINKIIKNSFLPHNLGNYIIPKGTKYNKESKTLFIDGTQSTSLPGKGNNLLRTLSGMDNDQKSYVNFFKKSINLVNPTTNKTEEFTFKGWDPQSKEFVFDSKNGINMRMKPGKGVSTSLHHKKYPIITDQKDGEKG